MATRLRGSLSVNLAVGVRDVGDLSTLNDTLRTGAGGFPSIAKLLDEGTGPDQARKLFAQNYTIANGANQDIDLQALVDRKGAPLSFSLLKWFLLVIPAPAAGAYLVIAPHPTTNPFFGWLGGTAPQESVAELVVRTSGKAGWAVTGTAKQLRISNPSTTAVTATLALVGS